MALNSLLDKVKYLLELSKAGEYTDDDLKKIELLSGETSEHAILGTFFGFSVSEYAIATLKWLNTEETKNLYNSAIALLNDKQKEHIKELVNRKIYLEI